MISFEPHEPPTNPTNPHEPPRFEDFLNFHFAAILIHTNKTLEMKSEYQLYQNRSIPKIICIWLQLAISKHNIEATRREIRNQIISSTEQRLA